MSNPPSWPPSTGLSTILVPHKSTVLATSGRTTIHAPADLIFSTLIDTSRYSEWNSFAPSTTIHTQPPGTPELEHAQLHKGTRFTLHVVMNPAKPDSKYPTNLVVTDISTPSSPSSYVSPQILEEDGSFAPDLSKVWRIAWTVEGGLVSKGLRTERFSEVIALDDLGGQVEGCEYRTWECQGGVLARTVKWMYERTLTERFGDWCRDLKAECERKGREREGEGGGG